MSLGYRWILIPNILLSYEFGMFQNLKYLVSSGIFQPFLNLKYLVSSGIFQPFLFLQDPS